MNEPPTLDFDYDTMTLAQALPWLKGVAMILIGGMAGAWLGCSGAR